MSYREEAATLRQDEQHYYNCAQSVLIPFAERCGMTRDQAEQLGSNFGSGMHCGGTCGAVTGALMVLGLAGKDEAAAKALTSGFRGKNNALDCPTLLKNAKDSGIPRKPHCDGAVQDAVALLEEILG